MKNYAKINSENIVEMVIVADSSFVDLTKGYFIEVTDSTGWAGPGSLYSKEHNKFIQSKPFESWILNESIFDWEAPKPKPDSGKYFWNDSAQEWQEIV